MRHDIPVDTTLGVESSTVLTVGQWYLDSRSAHRDAHVIEVPNRRHGVHPPVSSLRVGLILALGTSNVCRQEPAWTTRGLERRVESG